MNWDDLKYVLALKEGCTLSSAARSLGVSHATVSRRVEAFEASLPARLFERSPQGYEPTELGLEVTRIAEAMQANVLQLNRVTSAWQATPKGRVRLAIPGFFGPAVSARVGRTIRQAHPEIMVEFFDGQTFVSLRKHEADLAVRLFLGKIEDDPELRIRKLGLLKWSLWAAPELAQEWELTYPVQVLGHVPVVSHSDLAPANPGFEFIESIADPLTVVIECNSLNATAACVADGLGVACIPDFLGRDAGLVKLSDSLLSAIGAVVMHPDMARSPRVRLVADVLVDSLAAPGMPFE